MKYRLSSALEIVCDEFGCHSVYKALKYKESYRNFKRDNPSSLSDFLNELSCKWQTGNAQEYLETLDEWIQICLICHLAEDYINDKLKYQEKNSSQSVKVAFCYVYPPIYTAQ
jgi:hypothetical protein